MIGTVPIFHNLNIRLAFYLGYTNTRFRLLAILSATRIMNGWHKTRRVSGAADSIIQPGIGQH